MADPRDADRLGLFAGLSDQARGEVLAAFRSFALGPGEDLLAEGEPDRSMVLVADGELGVSLGGVEIGRVQRGDTAGEMALFGSFDRRSATVRTLTAARLLVLDEQGLKYLRLQDNPLARTLEARALRTIARRLRDVNTRIAELASGEAVQRVAAKGFFGRIASALGVGGELPKGAPPVPAAVLAATPGFVGRDEELLASMASRMEIVAVPVGEVLIEEGERGDDAFVVAHGKVGVYCTLASGKVEHVATLGPGHTIGQVDLADPRGRSATCRALEPLWLLRIPGVAWRALEAEHSRDGRAFRRGMIDSVSIQLRLGNEHLLALRSR